jgi:hypothetical protein
MVSAALTSRLYVINLEVVNMVAYLPQIGGNRPAIPRLRVILKDVLIQPASYLCMYVRTYVCMYVCLYTHTRYVCCCGGWSGSMVQWTYSCIFTCVCI